MRQIKTLVELEEGKYYLGYHPQTRTTYKHINIFKHTFDDGDSENKSVFCVVSTFLQDHSDEIDTSDPTGEYEINTYKDEFIGTDAIEYFEHGAVFELTTTEVMLHTDSI